MAIISKRRNLYFCDFCKNPHFSWLFGQNCKRLFVDISIYGCYIIYINKQET